MIIALDYDKTYTADVNLWNDFVKSAVARGHKVICLTMRFPEEKIENWYVPIYYTSRQAKLVWAAKNNIHVDIWIDDNPLWLFEGAS